jgi:hypothetical protein
LLDVAAIGEAVAWGLALWFLIFTEFPLPLRFFLPFVFAVGLAWFRRGIEKWLTVLSILTAYQCVVAALFVELSGTGNLTKAVYLPIRNYAVAMVILLAFKRASFMRILFSLGIWAGAECLAVLAQASGIDVASKLPFRVYTDERMAIFSGERFRGFTAESGVLGGMSSLFLLLLSLIAVWALHESKWDIVQSARRISRLKWIGLVALVLVTIIGLTLTKSSFVVLTASLLSFLVLSSHDGDWRSFGLAMRMVIVVGLASTAIFFSKPEWQEYIEQETQNISSYWPSRRISHISNSGFATRTSGVKLAFYGIPDYPFGVGCEGIATYLGKNLDRVEMSDEMNKNELWRLGPKCFALNTLVLSGIPGLILLVWLFWLAGKPFRLLDTHGASAMPATLFVAILALSLAVELLPMMGLCALIQCTGLALAREWGRTNGSKPEGFQGMAMPDRSSRGRARRAREFRRDEPKTAPDDRSGLASGGDARPPL